MDTFRFADNLDGEAVVALGLPAYRLLLLGLGSASAWAVAEVPLPTPLRLGVAGLLALTTGTMSWGKVQGVSVARWSWLCLGFASRLASASAEFHSRWIDTDPGSTESEVTGSQDDGPGLVAFLSLRAGVGCTTVCRAVKSQLLANAQESGDGQLVGSEFSSRVEAGRIPMLLDWGTGPQNRPLGSRLVGLILVWDGEESYRDEFSDKVALLRRRFPGVVVLVALNCAQSSAGLRTQIAGAGARLAAAVPVDGRPGDGKRASLTATTAPASDGVKMLAREVLAASRSW
ncbi:MAG: hypothetical protein WA809_01280 [Candidatus Dormiibacterota bacterium]